MGCAFPEAEQGMNVARTSAIEAGLPVEVSAMTVNRYCSSGLQTIALAADRIKTGGAEIIVAGGLETMSMIPMGGNVVRPNPKIVDTYPDYYLNMGLTAENLAQKYEITRQQADEFSLQSHRRAAALGRLHRPRRADDPRRSLPRRERARPVDRRDHPRRCPHRDLWKVLYRQVMFHVEHACMGRPGHRWRSRRS